MAQNSAPSTKTPRANPCRTLLPPRSLPEFKPKRSYSVGQGLRRRQTYLPLFSIPRCVATCLIFLLTLPTGLAQTKGFISIDFLEDKTDQPLVCRAQVKNPSGRVIRPRGGGLMQGEWSLIEGPLDFKAIPGDYTYLAYHGPQFSPASGGFTLDRDSQGLDAIRFERHANLDEEGWYGGDLLSYVEPDKSLRWLPAEDLQMAAVVSEQPLAPGVPRLLAGQAQRWVNQFSYRDARPGSGLVIHHWSPPAEVPPELPSTRLLVMSKARDAAQQGTVADDSLVLPPHAEIQQLWARDVPIWLASGQVDSIQILSEHLTYDGSRAAVPQPLELPEGRFAGERGPGRMVERIYWQVLEAGLRLPPTAGSGFGKTPSPLGYNRVYASPAYADPRSWWEAVRSGRSFVTSGPLLRAEVNGQRPGHLFQIPAGETQNVELAVDLTVADPVEYLDVIFNGQSLYEARLDEHARQGGRIPNLEIKESGWMVVRVVTEREFTYRIATTAPFYFEVDGKPRVSRRACEYFERWLDKAAQEIAQLDEPSRAAAAPYLVAARKFWQGRSEAATTQ